MPVSDGAQQFPTQTTLASSETSKKMKCNLECSPFDREAFQIQPNEIESKKIAIITIKKKKKTMMMKKKKKKKKKEKLFHRRNVPLAH